MKKIRCVVIDDNQLDRLTLENFLTQHEDIDLVGIYKNPVKALIEIKEIKPDVAFLDIDMPNITGLELRKQILEVPICVFITDHPEFALESFELEVLDYLVKPLSKERFDKTLQRIREYIELLKNQTIIDSNNEQDILFIKEGHRKVKIILQDVLYLGALQNYITLHTQNEKHHILISLSSQLKKPAFENFIRIHRSYAINKSHIQSFSSKEVKLSNGEVLPIGRSYLDEFKNLTI